MESEVNENVVNTTESTPKLKDPWEMPEFVNSVVLADGTELKGHATLYEEAEELWVKLDEYKDMQEVYFLFSDTTKTSKIISHTSILRTDEFYGYTRLTMIKQETKSVTVRMKLAKTN